MDLITLALKSPTGFWVKILNAFKGAMGTYILAVILIAVIVRLVFSLVDIINKKVNMKNSEINAKMKPELEAVQKKYGNDQRLLQQKQQEVYKKYQFSMMGSCLPMLIMLVLQFVVFLTLWNQLQSVANYNIAYQYENMKYLYAQTINLNQDEQALNLLAAYNSDINKIEIEFDDNKENPQLVLKLINIENGSVEDTKGFNFKGPNSEDALTNQDIKDLLERYVLPKPEENEEEISEGESIACQSIEFVENSGYNELFIDLANKIVKQYFKDTQESFLWIKNIYRPESPSTPMFTKSEIIKYVSGFYDSNLTKEEKTAEKEAEGVIFDCVIGNNAQLNDIKKEKNGFYILTIIAVLTSFLSMWLTNKLMQNKNQPQQQSNKIMYFVMPIVYGIFTFMYTSLFAIYLIVGMIIMIVLTPLTSWIVKKWVAADNKKKKEKDVVVVDYRRKDN